uniref:hypothetical protein n=1 Tax=Xenorhabdus bovienii TaxID=40576 RepID=UPI001E6509B3
LSESELVTPLWGEIKAAFYEGGFLLLTEYPLRRKDGVMWMVTETSHNKLLPSVRTRVIDRSVIKLIR